MSDGTRISGYGSYAGFSQQRERSASLERFRRGRREGDIVSGVFLRFENDHAGWAQLEGEELLAALPPDGPRPDIGAPVYFRVEALLPEVVLRMVSATDPAVEVALAAGSRPLAQHAALYASARDTLDTLLHTALWPSVPASATLFERRQAFVAFVASSSDALEAYAEGLLRARTLQRAASLPGLAFFRHLPWLCPALRRLEVAFQTGGDAPVRAGGTLPNGVCLLVRGRIEKAVFRYRVEYTGAVQVAPEAAKNIPEASIFCLGMTQTARAEDVLGHILASAASSGGSGYRRKL